VARNTLIQFLELDSLKLELKSPRFTENKKTKLGRFSDFSFQSSSDILRNHLDLRLAQDEVWRLARPIILGSWSRHELCPQSDLDVLFLGENSKVINCVQWLNESGIKIRYRVPVDWTDLSVGVEEFDCLNLLQGQAFYAEDNEDFARGLTFFYKNGKMNLQFRKKIVTAILRDRKRRLTQYSSQENLLEPNLKNSPGGLRDIEQCLQLYPLVQDCFATEELNHALFVLQYAKKLFLQIRFELHLSGLQDHLNSFAQLEISKKYGFAKSQDFMREVIRNLDRAYFYSDWFFSNLQTGAKRLGKICSSQRFTEPKHLLSCFKKNTSILMQKRIRVEMDEVFLRPLLDKQRGKILEEIISHRTAAAVTRAVFRSRSIYHLCPRIKPLIAYVQHDQYHRWTADQHLLQILLELKNYFLKPKSLGPIAKYHADLTPSDWKVLSWACLYHDLAKGQETKKSSDKSKHDHSELGEVWVKSDLKKFGFDSAFIEEVAFLVRNHLELSTAAFRKNPEDKETWNYFLQLGMTPKRIRLLVVFTAIDIRATHPGAWTTWKGNLLHSCVQSLLSPEKANLLVLQTQIEDLDLEHFDSMVLRDFSPKLIIKELKSLKLATAKDESIAVLNDRQGRPWLRYFSSQDTLGIFAQAVGHFHHAGINIEQAIVQTIPSFGVFDLFKISKRHVQRIRRIDLNFSPATLAVPKIKVSSITVVTENVDEIILSFEGTDQPGFLWSVASALRDCGFFILKARVHTWGNRVEDLIHVRPIESGDGLQDRLAVLKKLLMFA
jgi:[protein-PII] uridylyltransferase